MQLICVFVFAYESKREKPYLPDWRQTRNFVPVCSVIFPNIFRTPLMLAVFTLKVRKKEVQTESQTV